MIVRGVCKDVEFASDGVGPWRLFILCVGGLPNVA